MEPYRVPNEALQLQEEAKIVVIGLGMYAVYSTIAAIGPDMALKLPLFDLSEDTIQDAATLICIAAPNAWHVAVTGENEVIYSQDVSPVVEPTFEMTYCRESDQTVYGFTVTSLQESATFTLGQRYMNTVLLIVNVASFDGESESKRSDVCQSTFSAWIAHPGLVSK